MNLPKISILIPTYNRANFLEHALNSITGQIEKDVECVIFDNASNDNTEEIVQKFQSKYPYIRYYKNDSNVGPDQNLVNCIEHAQGEYVWCFGDDDRMQNGAISSVLNVIETNKDLALIYVNYSAFDKEFKKK